jgi:hypothetical protein
MAQMSSAYTTWIANYLDYLTSIGELDEDAADKIYASAQTAIQTGAGLESYPLIDLFLETYGNVSGSLYGTGATAGMTDEEVAYLESQTQLNIAKIQEILAGISQTGQASPDTIAELEYLREKLEFDMKQANIGNQIDWANYELSKQQLELQRNEWLSELQANPANWIERWQAERMPWGGGRIPLESDKVIAQAMAPKTTSWSTSASATTSLPQSNWAMPNKNAPRINNRGTVLPVP